jgi:hypothetical protein
MLPPGVMPLPPEPVVPLLGLAMQLSVLLAPFLDCSHWAMVWKLQFNAPESLPRKQNAAFCWAMAAGAAASMAAITADEAMRPLMGISFAR